MTASTPRRNVGLTTAEIKVDSTLHNAGEIIFRDVVYFHKREVGILTDRCRLEGLDLARTDGPVFG